MTDESIPATVPISDPVVSAIGATGIPTPGDAVMMAALLTLEVEDPHPGVGAFVNAAAMVAFDAGCAVPAAISFVREMRDAYIALIDEPPERYEELLPNFAEGFMTAVLRRLPDTSDARTIAAAGLERYDYVMKAAAVALDRYAAEPADASSAKE
jgi:hypothetical protein